MQIAFSPRETACIASAWIGAIYDLNDHRITDRRGMPTLEQGESTSAKYQFYQTADRRFVLFCSIEHKFLDNFCRAVGREDLLAQKDTDRPDDFALGEDELRRELRRIFRTRTLEEWMRLAAANDICMGPAPGDVTELLEDPHVRERDILLEGDHPRAGSFTYVGQPAVIPGHRDAALVAQEVGRVQEVDVERVALDPFAAVEQPPEIAERATFTFTFSAIFR